LFRVKDSLEPDVGPIITNFLSAEVIAFLNEKPYAFLGNSLGAWLAYEIILEINKNPSIIQPVYFFPCASSPSHKRY
jgi:surfactin synthase thioesterase subunit